MNIGKAMSMLGYHKKARFFYKRARELEIDLNIYYLGLIENSILEGNHSLAKADLKAALNDITLKSLLEPLDPGNTEYYLTIPVSANLIKSFISAEFSDIDILLRNE